ncbi:NfeD family protein [Hippea maritima]|uniref:NfeD-like C-terminal domain-containing protein n=1 Tax=Hippea maritima (strain ATCC 700847 / DSM 10411 / MH2) TaxID=760142 RepID=F2LTH0_HIPMA|nr:NfeD family protein [Hippea maritima]AEA33295.1 protein of unknown function DUF107 [Hippea maritima DSM 10411]
MRLFIEFLIVFSFVLVIIELIINSGGIFAFSGITAFIFSMILLFIMDVQIPKLFLDITIPSFIVLSTISIIAVILAYKAYKKKPIIGENAMIGKEGLCIKEITPHNEGQIEINGEIWRATSNQHIKKGEKIKVVFQNSLKLTVKRS